MIQCWLCGVALGVGVLMIGSAGARAEVAVLDQVGIVGAPANLVVRTTSLFSADGGRLVEIRLEEEPLGRIMTGADGFGYQRAIPRRAGLLRIEAHAEGRHGSGRLLVLNPTDQAVLIEAETVLKSMIWEAAARDDCRSGLESISRGYRVIYVSRWLGADFSRSRLSAAGLPESVVLTWKGAALLTSLQNQGVQIAALVGSAGVVSESRSRINRRFTFEKTRDATVVNRWAEISEQLNAAPPH